MSHNTKYYRKKLKKTESSKKIDVLFRQQALAPTTNGKADFKICYE